MISTCIREMYTPFNGKLWSRLANIANGSDDTTPAKHESGIDGLPLNLVFEIASRKRKVDDDQEL